MSIVSYKTVKGSAKSAHQQVEINDQFVGEVWREQARVIVSKLSQPLRQEMKWRWFARIEGTTKIFGREGRALVGPGFASKDKAVDAMEAALAAVANGIGKTPNGRNHGFCCCLALDPGNDPVRSVRTDTEQWSVDDPKLRRSMG